MTTLNVENRQPDKLDYASPVQFRFKILKIPNVEFFVQSVNIPGITLGEATQTTPLKDIPIPGDKLNYASLDLSFLVDENLNKVFQKTIHSFVTLWLQVQIDFLGQQHQQEHKDKLWQLPKVRYILTLH